MPKGKELSILSYKAFVSADATNDNNLDFTELVNWVELNQHFISFLNEYEPSNPVTYDNKIYEGFVDIDVRDWEQDPLNIKLDSNRLLNALT